jgi:beta-phosphoglucomutase
VRARAVIFDFNGTLSDDEPVLCEIWRDIFAVHGEPLSAEEYFDRLAGLSDPEIARTWLGPEHPRLAEAIEERARRYRRRAADGATVSAATRAAVRYAAERVPVAVVSGAARDDVGLVLAAAGLRETIAAIVAAEDVERGKPDPEGYVRALTLLDRDRDRDLEPSDVVVLEDSEVGIEAAKAAGMRCLAVFGTLSPDRLAAADAIVDRVDVELMRKLVG